jgi:hypothetical protein
MPETGAVMKIRVLRSRWTAVALAFAVAFAAWILVANQRSHATVYVNLPHSHLAAPSYTGPRKPVLVRPKAVRDKIQRLNHALETCLIANGATRVDLAEGGYMYRSNASTSAACASQADAIDTYINSDAYHASDVAAHRLLKQFWDCFNRLPEKTEAAVESCRVNATNPQ